MDVTLLIRVDDSTNQIIELLEFIDENLDEINKNYIVHIVAFIDEELEDQSLVESLNERNIKGLPALLTGAPDGNDSAADPAIVGYSNIVKHLMIGPVAKKSKVRSRSGADSDPKVPAISSDDLLDAHRNSILYSTDQEDSLGEDDKKQSYGLNRTASKVDDLRDKNLSEKINSVRFSKKASDGGSSAADKIANARLSKRADAAPPMQSAPLPPSAPRSAPAQSSGSGNGNAVDEKKKQAIKKYVEENESLTENKPAGKVSSQRVLSMARDGASTNRQARNDNLNILIDEDDLEDDDNSIDSILKKMARDG